MALTPAEIANAPTIELGGRRFHIPRLAIKQNRVVVGGLKRLLPVLAKFEEIARAAKASLAEDKVESGFGFDLLKDFPIEDGAFDVLCDVVYIACTRGNDQFSRAEFDEMPIGADELMMALPTIMAQSFAFSRKGDPAPSPEAQPAPAAEPVPAPN